MSSDAMVGALECAYDLSAIEALMLYWEHRSPEAVVLEVFPGSSIDEVTQKLDECKGQLSEFWHRLDWSQRVKLVLAARSGYTECAMDAVNMYVHSLVQLDPATYTLAEQAPLEPDNINLDITITSDGATVESVEPGNPVDADASM
jgi:hypothetical protein